MPISFFVIATSQNPGTFETLASVYSQGMCLLTIPVIACFILFITVIVVLAYCCLIISAREDEWWEEQEKERKDEKKR